MYSSRAFPYKLIDPSSTEESEVLFPLVDALNHKPNTKITWSRSGDSETGSLTFVAGQEYQVGDEIFNNYGPKSNEERKYSLYNDRRQDSLLNSVDWLWVLFRV
ncbi:hypothetical protein G6F57_021492 [Rhizopus arrhizus]|nr:hypothetical protein G6F57_021492 [Rhizopus arrhizus]